MAIQMNVIGFARYIILSKFEWFPIDEGEKIPLKLGSKTTVRQSESVK